MPFSPRARRHLPRKSSVTEQLASIWCFKQTYSTTHNGTAQSSARGSRKLKVQHASNHGPRIYANAPFCPLITLRFSKPLIARRRHVHTRKVTPQVISRATSRHEIEQIHFIPFKSTPEDQQTSERRPPHSLRNDRN